MINTDHGIVITRVFDAPIELVWNAWTDPDMIKRWWGPTGFTAPVVQLDLRVGGKYLYCMRGAVAPGAPVADFWSTGTIRAIEPMEQLVLTDAFSDEHGNIVDPTAYGMSPDFPKESEVTISFDASGHRQTRVTICFPTPKSAATYHAMLASGMDVGWEQSLDKFAESLKVTESPHLVRV